MDDVVIDGEITALNGEGLPDFHGLKRVALANLLCFDLLYARADDLRELPLGERKSRLRELTGKGSDWLRFSESFHDAHALLRASERMGLEEIVSKRRDGKYKSGPQQTLPLRARPKNCGFRTDAIVELCGLM